ncbi:MAG TPA: serine hydrolase [Thermoanaerobaculia bacterium]
MRRFLILVPLTLALCACATTQYPKSTLPGRVEEIARRNRGGTISVAFLHLDTGQSFSFYDTEPMHAASTMKVPVMMALFEAVDSGEMRLDEPVPVKNQFQSIVDGSPYSLDPKEDGDPDLYQTVGQTRPLEELIRRMIVRSSNLATNLLIERIGASRVTELMRRIGAYDIHVLRGVEDGKAFQAGLNNRTTAKDLRIVLRALLPGGETEGAFSEASRQRMLDILKAQEFNEKIPAGIPRGTPVAHKTGDITGIHHDAAIVLPPGKSPYILVVLTDGFQDEEMANGIIAEVSRAVWEMRERPLTPRPPLPEGEGEKNHAIQTDSGRVVAPLSLWERGRG